MEWTCAVGGEGLASGGLCKEEDIYEQGQTKKDCKETVLECK